MLNWSVLDFSPCSPVSGLLIAANFSSGAPPPEYRILASDLVLAAFLMSRLTLTHLSPLYQCAI